MDDWVSVDIPPIHHSVVNVKQENGDCSVAYFHKDKMDWLLYYSKQERSHYQEKKTGIFLFDVTHWKPL